MIEILKKLIDLKIKLLNYLLNQQRMNEPNRIEKFALAIREHEGWYQGSRSWRNLNPGNLKFNNQYKSIGQDKDGFARFRVYEDGFNALCHQLTIACNGESKVYNPEMTLLDFFNVYAPSGDGQNNPIAYATAVSKKIGITVDTKLKDILTI